MNQNYIKQCEKTINTFEFMIGFFVAFVLTSLVFTIIITEAFVAKNFLRLNNIYLDGHYYKLQRVR